MVEKYTSLESQITEAIHKIRNKSKRPDVDAMFKWVWNTFAFDVTFQVIDV